MQHYDLLNDNLLMFPSYVLQTRIMGWFLFQRALWRVFLNYMLCFRYICLCLLANQQQQNPKEVRVGQSYGNPFTIFLTEATCLQEIHGLHGKGVSAENISSQLSPWASALFEFLPPFIGKQVCIDLLMLAYAQFTSDFSCYNIIVSLMQLLLHPESDDSAQLSQVQQNMEPVIVHLFKLLLLVGLSLFFCAD